MAEPKNYTRVPSLDSIIICAQCGALFLNTGWSNETHLEWHRGHDK